MAFEHDPEKIWQAQELYCVDRFTFERVAQLTGVASSTLRRWADSYQWREKREEIAQAESDIRVNMIRARKAMLEKLLLAGDGKEASQAAFAVSSLEATALKQQELLAAGKIFGTAGLNCQPVTTRAEAVAVLRSAVEQKLGLALSDPAHITTATVQDVKRCLELVAELEAGLPTPETVSEEKRGLSQDVAAALEKALGLHNDE